MNNDLSALTSFKSIYEYLLEDNISTSFYESLRVNIDYLLDYEYLLHLSYVLHS